MSSPNDQSSELPRGTLADQAQGSDDELRPRGRPTQVFSRPSVDLHLRPPLVVASAPDTTPPASHSLASEPSESTVSGIAPTGRSAYGKFAAKILAMARWVRARCFGTSTKRKHHAHVPGPAGQHNGSTVPRQSQSPPGCDDSGTGDTGIAVNGIIANGTAIDGIEVDGTTVDGGEADEAEGTATDEGTTDGEVLDTTMTVETADEEELADGKVINGEAADGKVDNETAPDHHSAPPDEATTGAGAAPTVVEGVRDG